MALGVLQLRLAWRQRASDRLVAQPLPKGWLLSVVMAVVVLALPPQPSFSDLASSRPSSIPEAPRLTFVLPPVQRTLTEWVRLLRTQPDPSLHEGAPLSITGFVFQPPEGPPHARLMVRCLVDATPTGCRCNGEKRDACPRHWLRIRGTMAYQWMVCNACEAHRSDGDPRPESTRTMSKLRLAALPRPLAPPAGLAALVLVQQQVLLRRPPRLRSVAVQPLRSGAAALDVRFSRPMQPGSVPASSRLSPDLSHRWFGENDAWRLLLDQPDLSAFPIQLELAGQDLRGLALPSRRLFWDPRPTLVAVVQMENGQQQLQLLELDGSWLPLTPTLPSIFQIEPLGNGQGVAFVATDDQGDQFVAMRHLTPRSLGLQRSEVASPELGRMEALTGRGQLFGHVSSNLNGDLLVQAGRMEPGSDQLWMRRAAGERRDLEIQRSGPIRLLPDGTGLVVPDYDGLSLQGIDGSTQMLSTQPWSPGSAGLLHGFRTRPARAPLARLPALR